MAYNQESFNGYTNNAIVDYINYLNNELHTNLPIANASIHRGGARRMNIRTLYNYLNRHNAQQIIGDEFTFDRFMGFVDHERDQQIRAQQIIRNADNEFFNNFNKSEYKVTDPLDELIRINAQNKFDEQLNKQRRIEHAIQRAKDAVSEAIQLIKESKIPALNKVDRTDIKNRSDDISHLLDYYIPENALAEPARRLLLKENTKSRNKNT